MYYNFDGIHTELTPIFEFEIVNEHNIKLNFIGEKEVCCFVTLTPREISHIMIIGLVLDFTKKPT